MAAQIQEICKTWQWADFALCYKHKPDKVKFCSQLQHAKEFGYWKSRDLITNTAKRFLANLRPWKVIIL